MENHHFLAGKIHYFDWVIFHCKLLVHQKVLWYIVGIETLCVLYISLFLNGAEMCKTRATPRGSQRGWSADLPAWSQRCWKDCFSGQKIVYPYITSYYRSDMYSFIYIYIHMVYLFLYIYIYKIIYIYITIHNIIQKIAQRFLWKALGRPDPDPDP